MPESTPCALTGSADTAPPEDAPGYYPIPLDLPENDTVIDREEIEERDVTRLRDLMSRWGVAWVVGTIAVQVGGEADVAGDNDGPVAALAYVHARKALEDAAAQIVQFARPMCIYEDCDQPVGSYGFLCKAHR